VRQSLIVLVVFVFALGTPIELLWFGWAMKKMFAEAPVWVSVVVLIEHFALLFGLATLLDKRHPQGLP
jgi:sulfite exporter TauE/SafE